MGKTQKSHDIKFGISETGIITDGDERFLSCASFCVHVKMLDAALYSHDILQTTQ